MRFIVTLTAMIVGLSAGCASSHLVSDGGRMPDAMPADAAVEDADAALDAIGPTCHAGCIVQPLVTAVLERPRDQGNLEILSATPVGSSSLTVLLSVRSAPPSIPPFKPVWYRMHVDLEAGSVGPMQGGLGLPIPSGDPDSPATAFDDAVVRGADSAVVLYRPHGEATSDPGRIVRAASLNWTGDRLERTDLGPIFTLSEPPGLWDGSLFELSDGNLVAAIEYGGVLHAARIAWGVGGVAEIVSSVELGAAGEAGVGMAALSAGPAPDGQWAFAGGGLAQGDSPTAFAALAGPSGAVWAERLGGSRGDPPPQVVGGPDGAWVMRWEQNPSDTQDTSVVVRSFQPSGLGPPERVSTAPVPLPLQAQGVRAGGITYAIWNVQAPDDETDGLVHVVLFGASDACPATQVQRLARLPGGTPQPASIYALEVDGTILLLALASVDDSSSAFSALRVSCSVDAGG